MESWFLCNPAFDGILRGMVKMELKSLQQHFGLDLFHTCWSRYHFCKKEYPSLTEDKLGKSGKSWE